MHDFFYMKSPEQANPDKESSQVSSQRIGGIGDGMRVLKAESLPSTVNILNTTEMYTLK